MLADRQEFQKNQGDRSAGREAVEASTDCAVVCTGHPALAYFMTSGRATGNLEKNAIRTSEWLGERNEWIKHKQKNKGLF